MGILLTLTTPQVCQADSKIDTLLSIQSLSFFKTSFPLLFETRTFPKTLMNNSSSYTKFWDFPDDTQHTPFFLLLLFLVSNLLSLNFSVLREYFRKPAWKSHPSEALI